MAAITPPCVRARSSIYSGAGTLRTNAPTKRVTVDGSAASRRINVVDDTTGLLVDKAWSDSSGEFAFYGLSPSRTFSLVGLDYTNEYGSVIVPGVYPATGYDEYVQLYAQRIAKVEGGAGTTTIDLYPVGGVAPYTLSVSGPAWGSIVSGSLELTPATLDASAVFDVTAQDATGRDASVRVAVTTWHTPVEIVPSSWSQSSIYGGLAATVTNMRDDNTGATATGAATNSGTEWIKADLGAAETITKITLGGGTLSGWGSVATYLNGALVQSSTDNTNWTTQFTVTGSRDTNPKDVDYPLTAPVTARYWRLSQTSWLACCTFRFWS